MMNDGVSRATWWLGFGECQDSAADTGANFSTSLYGWQNFGSYDQVSDGWNTGDCGTNSQAVPYGTVLPTGYAEQLTASFAVAGNNMLSTAVSGTLPNVRAYGATQGTGFALMLFNLDQASAVTVTVGVSGTARTSFAASTVTYGKAQYDDSAPTLAQPNGVWTAPVSQSLGTVSAPVSVTLPAWSMTVLKLQ
jgi:hypothetical protein